jgi:hypothetical protein
MQRPNHSVPSLLDPVTVAKILVKLWNSNKLGFRENRLRDFTSGSKWKFCHFGIVLDGRRSRRFTAWLRVLYKSVQWKSRFAEGPKWMSASSTFISRYSVVGTMTRLQTWPTGGGGKGGRCVGLTTLPPSCADCLEIWEPQSPGTIRAYNGIAFTSPYMHLWHEQEKFNLLQLRIFYVYCLSEVKISPRGLTVNTLRHLCTCSRVNVVMLGTPNSCSFCKLTDTQT